MVAGLVEGLRTGEKVQVQEEGSAVWADLADSEEQAQAQEPREVAHHLRV